jgi:tetratricopeptide (TPR) repeat protein
MVTAACNARPARLIARAVAIVWLAGGALWSVTACRGSGAAAPFPAPPAGTTVAPAVASHLAMAYAAAAAAPRSPDTVGALCLAYHADMLFDFADRCYAVVIELAPDDWHWLYYRAIIQSERGGGEALRESLRRVLTVSPQFAAAWLRLGDAEFKAGEYDAARDAWLRASALPEPQSEARDGIRHVPEVPLSAYAALGLARVAMVRGEQDQARDILEKLRQQAPQFGSVLRLLADTYRTAGKEPEAATLIRRARRLPDYAPYADPVIDTLARESRNSVFLLQKASEANLATNAAWSEYLTRRALEFDPSNPEVIVKLGRLLRTIGRNDEALVYFRQYQQLVPGDYLVYAHIGSCLSALGRYEEAESFLRRAIMGLDDATTHYNLALLLAQTGRPAAAIEEYTKALERDPMHADARMNLATTLARQGRLDQAGRELTTLLEQDPDNAVARTNLGLVLLQQGRTDRARAELEAALRIDPQLTPASEALRSLAR